jgi:uncharacterized protein YndB with AHSA1/START domain
MTVVGTRMIRFGTEIAAPGHPERVWRAIRDAKAVAR